jgi:hypothetical protein
MVHQKRRAELEWRNSKDWEPDQKRRADLDRQTWKDRELDQKRREEPAQTEHDC